MLLKAVLILGFGMDGRVAAWFQAVVEASLEDHMWTAAPRRKHSRECLRYGSDLTDAEWRTGRSRAWPLRELLNAIFSVLRGGCAWRHLPQDFPPASTAYGWFVRFRPERPFEAINHHLFMRDRAVPAGA